MVELRALYAICLQAVNPQATKVKSLVDRLLKDRQGVRWTPDKATGPATLAVCQWLSTTKVENQRFALKVLVNGQLAKELSFDRNTRTQTINVAAGLIKERGKQRIQFQLTGRGQFTYQCRLLGFRRSSTPQIDSRLERVADITSRHRWNEMESRSREGSISCVAATGLFTIR